jgi:hypothetical protein
MKWQAKGLMSKTAQRRDIGVNPVLSTQILLIVLVLAYCPDFARTTGLLPAAFFILGFLLTLGRWGRAVKNGALTAGVCWSFWLIFLCITPLIEVSLNSFPWPQTITGRLISNILALLTLSTFALAVGEVIAEFRINDFSYFDNRLESDVAQNQRSTQDTLVKFFSVLGLLFAVYAIRKIGIGPFFTTRFDFTMQALPRLGNTTTAPLILAFASTLTGVCGVYWLTKLRRSVKVSSAMWILATLPVALFLANPLVNARFITWTLLGCIVLATLRFGKLSRSITILALPLALIILFPALDYFRDNGPTRNSTSLGSLKALTTNGDYDAFQMLGNVVAWTGQHGLQLGHQFIGVPLVFVPRSIWSGKPLPTGPMVSQDIGYGFTNLSSPLPSEGYIDFGIFGVIAFCMLWGWMMVRLDKRMLESLRQPNSELVTCIITFFAIYQVILLRGSLLGTIARLFPALLMIIFLAPLQRRRRNPLDTALTSVPQPPQLIAVE